MKALSSKERAAPFMLRLRPWTPGCLPSWVLLLIKGRGVGEGGGGAAGHPFVHSFLKPGPSGLCLRHWTRLREIQKPSPGSEGTRGVTRQRHESRGGRGEPGEKPPLSLDVSEGVAEEGAVRCRMSGYL